MGQVAWFGFLVACLGSLVITRVAPDPLHSASFSVATVSPPSPDPRSDNASTGALTSFAPDALAPGRHPAQPTP